MSIEAAKKTAWNWFSKYVRLRDCLKTTGQKEYGRCISCNKIHPFGEADAGHYVPGRKPAYLFEETNCHFQCKNCNWILKGNRLGQHPKLIELYGQEEIDRLESLKHKVVKLSEQDYREIAKDYRLKYKELLNGV